MELLHLSKVADNEDFFQCLVNEYPDRFFDWKITIQFYVAYHLIKALAEFKGISIGDDHHSIHASIRNSGPSNRGKFPLKEQVWKAYFALYNCSKDARYKAIKYYDGQLDDDKKTLNLCIEYVAKVKGYVVSQGVQILN